MEKNAEKKLAKEKKVLIKKFKDVIKDLLDHYEIYTEEEKKQIQEVFQKVADLNQVLDKYDDDKNGFWGEYLTAYGQYFHLINY